MRTIRLLITATILSCAAVSILYAQKKEYRTIESSSKTVPGWVNAAERDYLNVSATAGDIETAKATVMELIKKQIAESIATRIVSESSLSTSAIQVDGKVSSSRNLESSILSRTAKLPFIGEISLSKAADSYWEKRYYRSTGSYEYFYAVRYPFSEFEMKKLVMEYQEHDRRLNERLSAFTDGTDYITSVEDIGDALLDLRTFLEEFDIQDPRYSQVQSIANRYRELYSQITIDWFQEKKGVIVVSLSLAGRSISTSQKPQLKSNCATQMSSSYEGNALIIKYNDEYCYEDDQNWIEVRFRAGNEYISARIPFKNNVDISLTGIVSDESTGRPLAYARLTLIPEGKTVMTGRNGMYVFNDLPAGNYSVQAYKKGYRTEEVQVYVDSRSTVRKDVILSQDPQAAMSPATKEPVPPTRPADEPEKLQTSGPDPLTTVLNGLAAYFRFNGTTRSEVSAIQGNPVNRPQYTPGSIDGTNAVTMSSIDGSQISFPKPMISLPNANYSITFWMKGFADGHIWSLTNGNGFNYPKLIMENGQFRIYNRNQFDETTFTHPALDYAWHFIAIVVKTDSSNTTTAALYIDGVLTDSIGIRGAANMGTTKFLLGGASDSGDNAIDTSFDNLRIYSSKALTEAEVAQIYMSENHKTGR